MKQNCLFLMLGYPGAGKTTASKLIADVTGATHIWADQERRNLHPQPSYSQRENDELYTSLNTETDKYLRQGKDVVFDTAFNHYEDRQKLRQIATSHNAQTIVVWVKTPPQVSKDRAQNSHNHAHTRLLGNMTDEHFHALQNKLEVPKSDERTIVLDGTKLTREYVQNILLDIL